MTPSRHNEWSLNAHMRQPSKPSNFRTAMTPRTIYQRSPTSRKARVRRAMRRGAPGCGNSPFSVPAFGNSRTRQGTSPDLVLLLTRCCGKGGHDGCRQAHVLISIAVSHNVVVKRDTGCATGHFPDLETSIGFVGDVEALAVSLGTEKHVISL